MHSSFEWRLCVYDNPMPPLYNQNHMLLISPAAQFLLSQLPLIPENCLHHPKIRLTPPLSALNQSSHVFPVPFLSAIAPSFPEGNFGISSNPPDLASPLEELRVFILLSRVTASAQHPAPRSVTHIPGVFSIWLPLVVHISFMQKDLYRTLQEERGERR